MAIQLAQPVTEHRLVPTPVEFDSMWITRFEVSSEPAGVTRASVVFRPWNTATGELGEEERHLELPDLFTMAAEDPLLGGVIQSLINELERQGKLHGVIS